MMYFRRLLLSHLSISTIMGCIMFTTTTSIIIIRCKRLEWVPYEAEYDPEVLTGDPWGTAAELLPGGGRNIPLLVASPSGDVQMFPVEVFENAYEDAMSEWAIVGDGASIDVMMIDDDNNDDDVIHAVLGGRASNSVVGKGSER